MGNFDGKSVINSRIPFRNLPTACHVRHPKAPAELVHVFTAGSLPILPCFAMISCRFSEPPTQQGRNRARYPIPGDVGYYQRQGAQLRKLRWESKGSAMVSGRKTHGTTMGARCERLRVKSWVHPEFGIYSDEIPMGLHW